MRTRPSLSLCIGALALVLAACSGSSGGEKPAAPPAATRLTVTINQLRFQPAGLALQVGRPVEITVRNTDLVEHDFVIRGMPATSVKNETGGHSHGKDEIAGHALAGQTVTVRFTPAQAGSYEFFCSIPGHRAIGMQGTVTVS